LREGELEAQIRNTLQKWILDMKLANFLSSHDDFCKTKELVQKIGTNPHIRDKSARFGAPVLSEFVCAYNTKTDFAHPLLPRALVKNFHDFDEVSFCGDGGNRTRVQEIFLCDSTKYSLFFILII